MRYWWQCTWTDVFFGAGHFNLYLTGNGQETWLNKGSVPCLRQGRLSTRCWPSTRTAHTTTSRSPTGESKSSPVFHNSIKNRGENRTHMCFRPWIIQGCLLLSFIDHTLCNSTLTHRRNAVFVFGKGVSFKNRKAPRGADNESVTTTVFCHCWKGV